MNLNLTLHVAYEHISSARKNSFKDVSPRAIEYWKAGDVPFA